PPSNTKPVIRARNARLLDPGRSRARSVARNSQGIQTATPVTGYWSQAIRNPQNGNTRPANQRPQGPTLQDRASRNIPRPAPQGRPPASRARPRDGGRRWPTAGKGSRPALGRWARGGPPQPTRNSKGGSRPRLSIARLNSSHGWNWRTGSIRSRLAGSYA